MENMLLSKMIAHASLGVYLFVLIWLLCTLRKMVRNQATQFIYATLCLWLLLAAKDISYIFGDTWYDVQVTNVLMSIDLWPTPIIGVLLMYALQPAWVNLWRISCMVTPFFIFTMLNIIFKGDPTIFMINQIYGFVFSTIFGIIIMILTFKCDVYIDANYSNKRQIDVRWVRKVTLLMYSISAIWFVFSIDTSWLGDALYYLATTVLSAFLFYFVMRHKEIVFPDYMSLNTILSGVNDIEIEIDTEQDISAYEKCFTEIEAELDIAINRDKVYLNPHLTLTDLAKYIGTNRTYLSRYINNYKATPFIQYINDFRCGEARQILKDRNSTLTMTEIAQKCGFASYSTFRRAFKQKYGYTPSEYRK